MTLSGVDIIDLFIRFAAVGQMTLVLAALPKRSKDLETGLLFGFFFCFASYLLLTAPIPDEEYGILRGLLLFFTDLTSALLWALGLTWLNHPLQPKYWSKKLLVPIIILLGWFFYFFVFLKGRGLFHDFNHLVGFLLISHLLFAASRNLEDDLNSKSRFKKKQIIFVISAYFLIILAFEFADSSFRNHPVFSMTNALVCLFASSLAGYFLLIEPNLRQRKNIVNEEPTQVVASKTEPESHNIPAQYQQDYQNLQQLLSQQVYLKSNLTVSHLADQLNMPAHQLREMLNQHIGFKNFSEFMNSYRIPNACQRLKDPAQLKTPILTIALETGFGSIGPFNRAFKKQMGITPSEYRRSFLK